MHHTPPDHKKLLVLDFDETIASCNIISVFHIPQPIPGLLQQDVYKRRLYCGRLKISTNSPEKQWKDYYIASPIMLFTILLMVWQDSNGLWGIVSNGDYEKIAVKDFLKQFLANFASLMLQNQYQDSTLQGQTLIRALQGLLIRQNLSLQRLTAEPQIFDSLFAEGKFFFQARQEHYAMVRSQPLALQARQEHSGIVRLKSSVSEEEVERAMALEDPNKAPRVQKILASIHAVIGPTAPLEVIYFDDDPARLAEVEAQISFAATSIRCIQAKHFSDFAKHCRIPELGSVERTQFFKDLPANGDKAWCDLIAAYGRLYLIDSNLVLDPNLVLAPHLLAVLPSSQKSKRCYIL